MLKYICYCFEHTEEDLRHDVRQQGGRSAILEQIVAAKKAGGCQCADQHPQGR